MATVLLYTFYGLVALLSSRLPGVSAAPAGEIHSSRSPGLKISYKETDICETTSSVRSFAGYVTLPATLDPAAQPYDANLFFWFFESRGDPSEDPLTLWVQGGPGLSTTVQAVSGHNGPCIVTGPASNETVLNPWSWNGASNMLYIDQPVQTGFSYDVVTDGYVDMSDGTIYPGAAASPGNLTQQPGKFGSQDPGRTANTTTFAAEAIRNFLELWFEEFHQYRRGSINVWSQSYGGHWAPGIASALVGKHKCRSSSSGEQFSIGIDSVGIISGYTDALTQTPYYPIFAVNNTYGIKAYDDSVAEAALDYFSKPGGCRDQGLYCDRLQAEYDPDNHAINQTLIDICASALANCSLNLVEPFALLSGRNVFDIAHTVPDSFPPPWAVGYLNSKPIQDALGAKVNLTEPQAVVNGIYNVDGDYARNYRLPLQTLLDAGVKVALIHGDRDYQCNWFGGEAVSLALNYSSAASFAAAGYADIATNDSYVGGVVRQHGRLSFSRVFQAGHEVPYYQPETAFRIYARTIAGLDVATGRRRAGGGYATRGPGSARGIGAGAAPAPAQGPPVCYVPAAPLASYCSAAQVAALAGEAALVVDNVVVRPTA